MEALIVTGLSGAGKNRALQIFEDIGYYCMDNITLKMLKQLLLEDMHDEFLAEKLAITVDIRSRGLKSDFDTLVQNLKKAGKEPHILFLDCNDDILLKRYKESRRLHPLMKEDSGLSLSEAIKEERKEMTEIEKYAVHRIDTSFLSTAKLREKICELFGDAGHGGMRINFMAFGYKYGLPSDCDLIFDVRCVPNPFYHPELRKKTGEDEEVRDFIMKNAEAMELFQRMKAYLEYAIPLYEKEGKGQLVVGLGCTGGQHRSVTYAKLLADHFGELYQDVHLLKRDMEANREKIIKNNL